MYLFGIFAVIGAFRRTHRLASLFLLSITVFSVTLLGLVVPNVGALYRFRYTFWVLLIVLGVKGLISIVQPFRVRAYAGTPALRH
jgi:hypothetical protein